jgi:hypothetical protein
VLYHELGDGFSAVWDCFPVFVGVHDFGDVVGLVAEEIQAWIHLLSR